MVSIVRYSILNPSIDLLQAMLTVSWITASILDITRALLVFIPQSTVHTWHFQFLAQSDSILMAHSTTNYCKASVQGILTCQSCGACMRSNGEYLYHLFCCTDRRRVVWDCSVQSEVGILICLHRTQHTIKTRHLHR